LKQSPTNCGVCAGPLPVQVLGQPRKYCGEGCAAEAKIEHNANWRREHREYAAEYSANWRREHPEYDANWRREHPGYRDNWQRPNPEMAAAYIANWQRANPETVAAVRHRRRARKAANGGSYTAAEWREKVALFANLCAYCGEARPLQVEHKIPISRGGTNDITNIVPACGGCNQRKGRKTAAEFLASSRREICLKRS